VAYLKSRIVAIKRYFLGLAALGCGVGKGVRLEEVLRGWGMVAQATWEENGGE
jgi:hypothetical protein